MFESAGTDYRLVDKISKGGLEEITGGEVERLAQTLAPLGFVQSDDCHGKCDICNGDDSRGCPAVGFYCDYDMGGEWGG